MSWLGCELFTLITIAFYTFSYNLGCNNTQFLITWGVIIPNKSLYLGCIKQLSIIHGLIAIH